MFRMARTGPACVLCHETDYELRDGYYYCTTCCTQSQEMGVELQMEVDGLLDQGMKTHTIKVKSGSVSTGRTKKSRRAVSRWTTAEGYTKILTAWVDQLEALAGVKDVRYAVLEVWAVYLRKLGIAFYSRQGHIM